MERHMACIRIFLNGIPDLVRPILGEYLCLLLPNSQQTLHHIYQLCNVADKAVRCSCIHVSKIFAFEWRWQRVIKIGLNSEYHLTGEITKFVKMLTHLLNYWNTAAHWTVFFVASLCVLLYQVGIIHCPFKHSRFYNTCLNQQDAQNSCE